MRSITEINKELDLCAATMRKRTKKLERETAAYHDAKTFLEEHTKNLLAERAAVGRAKMKSVLDVIDWPTPIIAYVVKRPDRLYHYAAIRVGERWYTTGHDTPRGGYTEEGLLDSLSQDGGYLVAWPLLLKAGEGA